MKIFPKTHKEKDLNIIKVISKHNMIKIRYYADDLSEQRHEKIIKLLNEIHNRHRILVEITRVRAWHGPISAFRGSIEYLSEEDAWKRDFCRNKDLSRNLGEAPSKIFKSRSGNLFIAGTVGVVVDGILQWAALYDEGLDFLQRVLELGESAVRDVYAQQRRRKVCTKK